MPNQSDNFAIPEIDNSSKEAYEKSLLAIEQWAIHNDPGWNKAYSMMNRYEISYEHYLLIVAITLLKQKYKLLDHVKTLAQNNVTVIRT